MAMSAYKHSIKRFFSTSLHEFGQCLVAQNKKQVPFSSKKNNSYIDIFKQSKFDLSKEHKNTFLLSQFLSPTGKLLPTSMTKISTKSSNSIAKAIRRARCMGLMPYICRKPFKLSVMQT
jgi:ribosomal protein S18